jgi:hypothetical protein
MAIVTAARRANVAIARNASLPVLVPGKSRFLVML